MTASMGEAPKSGSPTSPSMLATSRRAKKTVKVLIHGLMAATTRANSWMASLKVTEFTFSLIFKRPTPATLKMRIWKDTALKCGTMVKFTRANSEKDARMERAR